MGLLFEPTDRDREVEEPARSSRAGSQSKCEWAALSCAANGVGIHSNDARAEPRPTPRVDRPSRLVPTPVHRPDRATSVQTAPSRRTVLRTHRPVWTATAVVAAPIPEMAAATPWVAA